MKIVDTEWTSIHTLIPPLYTEVYIILNNKEWRGHLNISNDGTHYYWIVYSKGAFTLNEIKYWRKLLI